MAAGVPVESSAQVVTGRVVDVAQRPVPFARVAIWGDAELLAETETDQSGRFQMAVPGADVQRISIHHVGFETVVISGREATSDSVLAVLAPVPVSLPELPVAISRSVCDEDEDPDARALWNAARSSYSTETGRRGGLLSGVVWTGNVRSDSLGAFNEAATVEMGTRWRGGSESGAKFGWSVRLLERIVQREGYAWAPSSADFSGRHLNWAYPKFEGRHAYHFATIDFGAAHRFHLLRKSGGVTDLAFCPVDRESPWLEGRLVVAPDTTFSSVHWSIGTPEPREDARGEVFFTEALDSAGGRHLVAARGAFWRHNGLAVKYPDLPRTYYQRVVIYSDRIIRVDEQAPHMGRPTRRRR